MDSLVFAAKIQCHLDDDDVVTRILLVTRFSVVALGILMFLASLWYKEVYLFFLSIALKLNMLLNELLSDVIIKQSAPLIPCNNYTPALSVMGQTDVYGMPSFMSQHIYFFITVTLTYALLWRIRLSFLSLLSMMGYAALTCTAQVVLLYNTPWQIVAGAAVGVTVGLLYQLFIYYVLSPYFHWIISTRVFKYMGYQDRMCGTVRRFKLRGNLSDAKTYFHDVIWPLITLIISPNLGSQIPIDLHSVEQKVDEELGKLYTGDKSDIVVSNKNKTR